MAGIAQLKALGFSFRGILLYCPKLLSVLLVSASLFCIFFCTSPYPTLLIVLFVKHILLLVAFSFQDLSLLVAAFCSVGNLVASRTGQQISPAVSSQ